VGDGGLKEKNSWGEVGNGPEKGGPRSTKVSLSKKKLLSERFALDKLQGMSKKPQVSYCMSVHSLKGQ